MMNHLDCKQLNKKICKNKPKNQLQLIVFVICFNIFQSMLNSFPSPPLNYVLFGN